MSVAQNIIEKLTEALAPAHLEVINESHNHHVPPNSETHFKVIIASELFDGKRLLARHRAVNEALATEFANGLHALSMHTYSPSEWEAQVAVPDSPKCKG
ncbi:global transcriptional regulator BolA [Shewanella hanedai]|jgi:BolA protein|uniref:DNA-binding transcriptional regulator BolA n=1 Tax=Shewanella hanedai TaxID=25 RepID=A0A553JP16_SHEHA|nr:BolA/IbaG family iron-sulfur metabolism protein [Shewanella hanedai]TRY14195.1 BolA family transcriptional regulator [Shewanella hanedai]GGI83286.1 global transcriptional regulator BolA [Shewanella hanedai]